MEILALDWGKSKSGACVCEADTGEARFTTLPTSPRAVHERVRRGSPARKKIAIVAVARRLLVRCWAMLRDGTRWRPGPVAVSLGADEL